MDDKLAGPAGLEREGVEMAAQDGCLRDERRDRGPQLVGDVGDEPPVLGLGGLEPEDRVLERVGHPVEAVGPVPELVGRGDRHPSRQVAALDPLGGAAGLVDRGQDAARDEPSRHDRDERQDHGSHAERQAELVEGLLDRRHVVDQIDLGAGATGSAADDQARYRVDGLPRVRDLAAVDELADRRRDRVEGALERGRVADRQPADGHDDRLERAEMEGGGQLREGFRGRLVTEDLRREDREVEAGLVVPAAINPSRGAQAQQVTFPWGNEYRPWKLALSPGQLKYEHIGPGSAFHDQHATCLKFGCSAPSGNFIPLELFGALLLAPKIQSPVRVRTASSPLSL